MADDKAETKAGSGRLLLKQHHDVTAFASTDESRFALCGVHLNLEQKRVEATNGRVLMTVPFGDGDPDGFPTVKTADSGPVPDCIVPTAAFKAACDSMPQNMTLDVLESVLVAGTGNAEDGVTLSTSNLDSERTVRSKCIVANYPKLDNVVPTSKPKAVVTISADYLKRFCEYALAHGSAAHHEVRLEVGGPEDAVRVTVPLADGGEAFGMVMPVRTT